MSEPRQVAKTAFELARSIFIDTSAASREQKEHLAESGHTINRLCDKIEKLNTLVSTQYIRITELEAQLARLTPAPVHDVDQYYPNDMTATDAAIILTDARKIDDGGDCHVD